MPAHPADATLWSAILSGDLGQAEAALAAGADPNRRRGTKSMLARALEQPDSGMARLLLEAGASSASVAHGTTVLALAISRGFVDLIEPLARAGADLGTLGKDHEHTPAGLAVAKRNPAMLRELARLGAPLDMATRPDRRVRGEGRAHTLVAWCQAVGPKRPADAAWWEGLDLLLGLRFHKEAGAALAEAVSRMDRAIGEQVVERVAASAWGQPVFFQVLHIQLIYDGAHDWAGQVRGAHDVSVVKANPCQAGPWLATALAAAVYRTRDDAGRPRRMKKAVGRIETLLGAGADPHARQNDCPLAFWAVVQGLPWEAVQVLLEAGVDPMARLRVPVRGDDLEISRQALSRFWNGATLAHVMAWMGQDRCLRGLARRNGRVLGAQDKDGLTPLLRAVVPVSVMLGVGSRQRTVWPTLEALLDLGSDPRAVSTNGNGLAHLLALAAGHGVVPDDVGAILSGMARWDPDWLDRCDRQGRTGWAVLQDHAAFSQDAVYRALVLQQALDARLDEGSGRGQGAGRL